jgi:hypothetical protein
MKSEETLDHLLDLIKYYKSKMDAGTLTGSDGNIYLRSLMLLGLRDATLKSRHIESISDGLEVYNLPFEVRD